MHQKDNWLGLRLRSHWRSLYSAPQTYSWTLGGALRGEEVKKMRREGKEGWGERKRNLEGLDAWTLTVFGTDWRQWQCACTTENVSFCECFFRPLTTNSDLRPIVKVKLNHRAKYLGQRSFHSKLNVQTDTRTWPTALPGPLTWSVKP